MEDGRVIRLSFQNLSLETQDVCEFDYVEVYDGADADANTVLGRWGYCNTVSTTLIEFKESYCFKMFMFSNSCWVSIQMEMQRTQNISIVSIILRKADLIVCHICCTGAIESSVSQTVMHFFNSVSYGLPCASLNVVYPAILPHVRPRTVKSVHNFWNMDHKTSQKAKFF